MTTKTTLPSSGAMVPVIITDDTSGTNYNLDLATELAARINQVATRTAMAAVPGSAGLTRYLTESGREGLFVWSTANNAANVTADPQQGIYVAPSADTTGASGAWVRKFDGPLDVRWFGAVANDPGTGAFGTDAYAAIAAAAVMSQTSAIAGYVNGTIYRGGLPIHIPRGGYYCSQSIVPLFTGEIYGDGGKGWGAPTRIRMAAGIDGLQLQAHNTSGKTTFDGVTHFAGDRIHVHDIAFVGAYSGAEGDTHGIRGKRAGTIERCTFDGFEGDGLYCNTTFGSGVGSTEGNTNAMRVIDCDFQNNRRGRYMEGDDANAITLVGCSYINNRQAGINEESFLGNHEMGPHLDGNARTADNTGTAAKPASYCSDGTYRYACIKGQEAWCAANAPTGARTDNTGWAYFTDGAADLTTGVVLYAGGKTWRAGGPVIHDGASNSSSVTGCHIENNGLSQIDQGMVMLGTVQQVVRVTAGVMSRDRASTILSSSEGFVFGGSAAFRGDLRGGSATGNVFGPYKGATVQDGTTSFATRNIQHTFEFKPYDSAGVPGTVWLSIPTGNGYGRSNDFANGLFDRWKFNGTESVKHDSTGIIIAAGAALYNGTTKVVGARVTGWTAATNTKSKATFDTTTVTLPNLAAAVGQLIDDLIAHGLIGT